ncbi:MAG: hypothetical protein QF704_06915 [Anaerolineales bacterium]|nr:hypothetical protein [Anaerolineales bacterium]
MNKIKFSFRVYNEEYQTDVTYNEHVVSYGIKNLKISFFVPIAFVDEANSCPLWGWYFDSNGNTCK